MKSDVYKGFNSKVREVIDPQTGEILNKNEVMSLLARDIRTITDLAEWTLSQDNNLLTDLDKLLAKQPGVSNNYAGRALNLDLPKSINPRGIGASRFTELYRDRVISEAKSWLERVKAVQGTTSKRVSQGWSRTMNPTKPTDLAPKFSLSAVNSQYAYYTGNPFETGVIELNLVINKQWYLLLFSFDKDRFRGGYKLALPTVRVTSDNDVVFSFAVAYEYVYSPISARYVVGVDVGVSQYVTLVVWDTLYKKVVHESTLSQRVHSLWNSVRASEVEKRALLRQGNDSDAVLHRRAAARKKRELAVLAAQEVGEVAAVFDNAVVIIEDLSWVRNTMANGRWNRGELVEWLTHYVELNGGRVFKVSATGTSQYCSVCGVKGYNNSRREFVCTACGSRVDRDVNAASNIAQRFVGSLPKVVSSRSKSKRFTKKRVRRSPVVRGSLKYPGGGFNKDRSKNGPTPKQSAKRFCCKPLGEVFDSKCSTNPLLDCAGTVLVVVSESKSRGKTLLGQHDNSCLIT